MDLKRNTHEKISIAPFKHGFANTKRFALYLAEIASPYIKAIHYENYWDLYVIAKKRHIKSLLLLLRNNYLCNYEELVDIFGEDHPERTFGRFELKYVLRSLTNYDQPIIIVKICTKELDPSRYCKRYLLECWMV